MREPASTVWLRALIGHARGRLDPAQAAAMERWFNDVALDTQVLAGLRSGELGFGALQRHARTLATTPREDVRFDDRLGQLPRLFELAGERPAVVCAHVWHWLGGVEPRLASHLVHVIRERAGLPGLRKPITEGEPRSVDAGATVHLAWFEQRQLEDAASWLEHVPAPAAATFAEATAATEAQRAAAMRIPVAELAPFLQQAARFFLLVSQRELDTLGFPLSTEAQLATDPPLDERLELATWARRAGHAICLRGQLVVLRIPIQAPWPLRVELIAAELGRGVCGGAGLLLRLRGTEVVASAASAPLMLCLPGEPVEERGARFERWLSVAYPHAVDAWRSWA